MGVSHYTIEQRFWMKVKKGDIDACWEWIGAKDTRGYGRMIVKGKNDGSNRIAWQIFYGEIPPHMEICHKCDNTSCVNPNHLFLGTHQDNENDKRDKGRTIKGSKHGRAKLTEKDVLVIRGLYEKGNILQNELAQMFNVSIATISLIINSKHWKHI